MLLFDSFDCLQVVIVVEISSCAELVVALAYAESDFLPCDAVYLLDAFVTQVLVESVIGAYAIHGVCHGVDVPIVALDDVLEYLSAARLLGYDRRATALHCFERCYTERLRDGRHDEDIGVLVCFVDLLASLEAWEVETISYATFGSKLYHGVHHIS